LLYAVLQGAAERLEISEGDIDGALYRKADGRRALVLFDTVPGGAGGARLIASSLEKVLTGAMERVAECECGAETACYACLRSYRNARHHDALSREAAQRMLSPLGVAVGSSSTNPLPLDWQDLVDNSVGDAEALLVRRLHALGVPLPSQGFETSDGTPLTLAWPDARVGVLIDADSVAEQTDWLMLPGDADEIARHLTSDLVLRPV